MGVVVDMIKCSCGNPIKENKKIISWLDRDGNLFSINDVPVFHCNVCDEEFSPADVEFNIALLAEKMKKGLLPRKYRYVELI